MEAEEIKRRIVTLKQKEKEARENKNTKLADEYASQIKEIRDELMKIRMQSVMMEMANKRR